VTSTPIEPGDELEPANPAFTSDSIADLKRAYQRRRVDA